MAKRAHRTTEEVLEEILSDEEPVVELQHDWGEIDDGRDKLDRAYRRRKVTQGTFCKHLHTEMKVKLFQNLIQIHHGCSMILTTTSQRLT